MVVKLGMQCCPVVGIGVESCIGSILMGRYLNSAFRLVFFIKRSLMKNTSLMAEYRYRHIKMLLIPHSTSIIKRGQHHIAHLATISSRGHYQYPRRTLIAYEFSSPSRVSGQGYKISLLCVCVCIC